jgi:hypothetical protein
MTNRPRLRCSSGTNFPCEIRLSLCVFKTELRRLTKKIPTKLDYQESSD